MMQIASIRQIELLAMLALPPRRTLHRQTQEFELPLLQAPLLSAEQHHEGFHHQGETAAFAGPRHLYLMDSVGATPSPRHPGHQFAAVLEKVHMPPASFDGVVNSTQSIADRALEMFPWHVLESQFQRLGSPSKRHSATRHCRPNPSAAVKSSSGVILLIESRLAQNANPPPCLAPEQSTNSFCG